MRSKHANLYQTEKMDVFTQYNLIRTNHYRRVWLD